MSKKLLKSHNDLMNALLQIMSERDYASITISQICKVAGYNRGTFYQNYSSKDELLNDLINSKLQDMFYILQKSKQSISKQDHYQNLDYTLTYNLFDYVRQNFFFFKTIIEDKQIIGFRSKLFLLYQKELETLLLPIENPKLDRGIDEFYSVYTTSAAMGIIIFWINIGLKQSPDYLVNQFLSIVYKRPHDLIIGKIPFKQLKTKGQKEADPRILRTKESLSNSLIHLMKNNKYSEIKVNDILEHAHYNRSTFYSHFKSKDDLFIDTVTDFVEGMAHSIRKTTYTQSIDKNVTVTPLTHFFAYIYKNSVLLEVINANNNVPGFYNRLYSGLVELFCEELEGRFEYDVEVYSNYLASALLGIIALWISGELKYSPRYMAKLFTNCLHYSPKSASQPATVKKYS